MVSSGGIASCLNAENGEIIWKERIGSDFAASPLYVAGRIYLFDAQGVVTVLSLGTLLKCWQKNQMETGCMASAAVVSHLVDCPRQKRRYYESRNKHRILLKVWLLPD